MAFSVSPSVIVREVDASQAVPAISTPPAAMAGVFRWGPVNEPILITSENQLVDRFGKPTDDNYETFFTAADYLAYSDSLYVARADDGSVTATGTAFEAKYPGAIANNLEVAWVSSTGYESLELAVGDIPTNKISNVAVDQVIPFNSTSLVFEVSTSDRISTVDAGDILLIGNDNVGYQEIKLSAWSEVAISQSNTVVGYEYTASFANRYTLAESDLALLKVTKRWSYKSLFASQPDSNHIHVAVVDTTGAITGEAGAVVEVFENLSTTVGDTRADGSAKYFETVINNMSSWISVANTQAIGTASTSLSEYENLSGGTDATTESTATLAHLGAAWDTFKNGNEIDISFILQGKGDNNGTRANYIVSNVADYRRDCVAFLSPSKEAVVDEVKTNAKLTNAITYRNLIQSSNYWFMDSGYKYRYDKYNDTYRWTPLNGDMAGLAARVDPWESPAGFRKGIIKNVVKLAFNPSKPQRDQLYSSDINPVMSQIGQGIVLFGDKTGQGYISAFDRLNVRRLFIAVEKAIATAAESFLFELNDEFTQTQFKNIVDPFLRDIQGRRGIIDYRVISDSTVNTPEVIDQNKFRASIFIKPARSINVIELTFVATRTGVEFDEIVGQLT